MKKLPPNPDALTLKKIAALTDGTILIGQYRTYAGIKTSCGAFHKAQTDNAPKNSGHIHAFWADTIDKANQARVDALACPTCKGNGAFGCTFQSQHSSTWIKSCNVVLCNLNSSNAAMTAWRNNANVNNANIADDCHCPILFGGGIDHAITCNYLLSKLAKAGLASPI